MENNPLAQLLDIHATTMPSWWPLAAGWWLLAVISVILLFYLAWQWRKKHQARAPLKAAEGELHSAYSSWQATGDSERYTREANRILKRLCLWQEKSRQAAALHGEKWLAFLDGQQQDKPFSTGVGKALGDERFRPGHQQADVESLNRLLKKWLKEKASA